MSGLERRLAEDKALRDAALGLFQADIALVRQDLQQTFIIVTHNSELSTMADRRTEIRDGQILN